MHLVADGDEQEPLLGGGVPDGEEVCLLRDIADCAVDVVDRHLGGDLLGVRLQWGAQFKSVHNKR